MSKAEDLAKEFLKKLVSHTTLYKDTIDELEVYEPDDVIWAYKEGYHQAEKDVAEEMIEKVCEYIASNMRCDGYTLQTKSKFIKDLKQAMNL